MAQRPIDRNRLAWEKKDLARRARRLAQNQLLEADRARLMQFAAELDKEADALEEPSPAVPLPSATASQPRVQQQQVQQQQSAESSTHPNVPKEKH
jgi:hypothetical protein